MHRSRSRGAALVALLVAVVVLELSALAIAPVAVTARKRADEEELRTRLFAYKRAIELFRGHFGRYPTRLEELFTLPPNPRMIRALYPDPLTESGEWSIMRQTSDQTVVNVRSASTEKGLDGSLYAAWHYDENHRFTTTNATEAGTTPVEIQTVP